TLIVGNEAAQLAADAPGYVAKLQGAISQRLAPLRLGINVDDLFTRSDLAGVLAIVASSLGSSAFGLIQVLIYLGFLLAEQNDLTAKIARLQYDPARRGEGQLILRRIAAQLQSYLSVYTVLSAIMALASYALLAFLGVQFAAFW